MKLSLLVNAILLKHKKIGLNSNPLLLNLTCHKWYRLLDIRLFIVINVKFLRNMMSQIVA